MLVAPFDGRAARAQTPPQANFTVFEGSLTMGGQPLPAGQTVEVWGLKPIPGFPGAQMAVLCGTTTGTFPSYGPDLVTEAGRVNSNASGAYAYLAASGSCNSATSYMFTVNGLLATPTPAPPNPGTFTPSATINLDTSGQRDPNGLPCRTDTVGGNTPASLGGGVTVQMPTNECSAFERLLWNNEPSAMNIVLALFGVTNPTFENYLTTAIGFHADRDDIKTLTNLATALNWPMVRVSAVHYVDSAANQAGEYVEMKNFGPASQTMGGITMTVQSSGHVFSFGSFTLNGGQTCKIYAVPSGQSDACAGTWSAPPGPNGQLADTHDQLQFAFGVWLGEKYAW